MRYRPTSSGGGWNPPRQLDNESKVGGWFSWTGEVVWGQTGWVRSAVADGFFFFFSIVADSAEFPLQLVLQLLHGFEVVVGGRLGDLVLQEEVLLREFGLSERLDFGNVCYLLG